LIAQIALELDAIFDGRLAAMKRTSHGNNVGT